MTADVDDVVYTVLARFDVADHDDETIAFLAAAITCSSRSGVID